jgi:hypothetical protein
VRLTSSIGATLAPFDYLSVLISIVLGLSITQLLSGFAAMVRGRRRIDDFYWPLLLQMLALFLINVQAWWAMFGLRGKEHWTFAGFFVILLQPVTLYLMSAFITPDIPAGARVNLRAFYFREKNWFFVASVAALLVSLTKDVFVIQGKVAPADFAAHGVFLAMSMTGLLSNSDLVQKILAPLLVAFLTVYIALLFVALPQ